MDDLIGQAEQDELAEATLSIASLVREGMDVQTIASVLIHIDDSLTYAMKAQLGLDAILKPKA